MKQLLTFILISFSFTTSAQKTKPISDTAKEKRWLIKVIEDITKIKDEKLSFEHLKKSLTTEYYNYKQDAMNLEYSEEDPAVSEAAFKRKWKGKFNTECAGKGGIMVDEQDPSTLKVKSLKFIKRDKNNASLYKAVIVDLYYKSTFYRDIKIIFQAGKYFISDIRECGQLP